MDSRLCKVALSWLEGATLRYMLIVRYLASREGIVLARKRAAHSLAPRRRGPDKVLIHSRRPIGRLTVFGSGPYESKLSTGPDPKTADCFAIGCVSILCGE